MSGQPDKEIIKSAFEITMRLIDQMFAYDAPLPNGLSSEFIDKYERSGGLDWHTLYEDEETLGLLFLNELGPDIGIPKAQRELTPQDLVTIGKCVEELDESFNPAHPRKLKEHALTNGVRWMITTRALKTILTCRLRFGTTITELVRLAKEGDEVALLKLAKLDTTFLTTEFARKILREVELKQDIEFKKKLSNAIKPMKNFWTLKHPKKNLRDALALWVLSQLGYEDRPYTEWANFFGEQDYDNLASDQYVAKACKRYDIPKKNPKKKQK